MEIIILSFVALAVMRVVQKVCSKKVSNAVVGRTFFHYGGYYNLLSALFALITLCIVGFDGFDLPTVLCALGTAVFMAIELFTGIEALKGCSLIVSQMFGVGALFIPCIVGIFLFDEPMSLWQWLGLALFVVAMYFMIAPSKDKKMEEKPKQKIALKTTFMLVIGLLASGMVMVVQKVFAVRVPEGNVATYSFLMFGLNALILYVCYFISAFIKKEKKPKTLDREQAAQGERIQSLPKVLLVCGAFLALAVFAINQLVTTMGKTVSSAVLFTVSNAISIVITLLVGALYYKEKITWKNIIGIVLCVGALLIINLL
ncbi:MAG: EamA family transporter [Clostridia bacterium]|nr:EamA family transporter [Clostridia bacterium]